MLSRDMYTKEYIQDLYEHTGNDPALLERVIYAFGLLEASELSILICSIAQSTKRNRLC